MIPSGELHKRKRRQRADVLARRDALPSEARANASVAIAERVLALPELAHASSVMAFWSFGSEVDTRPLLERLAATGRRIALPRIVGSDIEAAPYRPGDETNETRFGAREPAVGAVVRPEEIDVVITPGVAFDRAGWRVGYGGGFYDRFLRKTRPDAPSIAVCFAAQLVDEVPHRPHQDLPVDAIVTETAVIRPRRPRAARDLPV